LNSKTEKSKKIKKTKVERKKHSNTILIHWRRKLISELKMNYLYYYSMKMKRRRKNI